MTAHADPAVTRVARDCPLLTRAQSLAAFAGGGKLLTAKGVLRRAEIGPACAAAGLPDPGRVVSAADVAPLHRAWVAAQGAGLLMLGHDRAHGAAPDSDALDRWRSGLAAVLRTESDDDRRLGAAIACRAVLSVLITAPGLDGRWFGDALEGVLEALPPADRYAGYVAFRRDRIAETGALELLAEGGAVDAVTRTVTPLGRWAVDVLAEPVVVAPAWADDEILQLRIDLGRFRPPVWRRVEVPAGTTLGQLHRIVQVLFEWADDHLHVFEIDGRSYADPIHDLGGCADEDDLALMVALPRAGATLRYRYDLGDCWDHVVRLENVLPARRGAGPVCVEGRGGAPVEDWPDEEPPPPPGDLGPPPSTARRPG